MANSWPYNTPEWQRLRMRRLTNEPFCRYCDEVGDVTLANVVDHIVPVRKDPSRAFDYDNTQSLCVHCHNGPKQAEDNGAKRRGCNINGIPLAGWE